MQNQPAIKTISVLPLSGMGYAILGLGEDNKVYRWVNGTWTPH